MEFEKEIAYALTGRFRKQIWRPFMSAVKEYDLICEGDRIAVCISGGKDSMLLAKCMQELQRHSPLDFELVFLCMNPGYTAANLEQIQANAAILGVPLELFDTDIFEVIEQMDCNPCYMCAKMRRGYLYRRAKKLGCNKLALGHHFDDVVETMLLSMLYAGQLRGMRPRLKSDNVEGMELIRPLYKVRERDIIVWRDHYELSFLACACRTTRSDSAIDSKRKEIKALLKELNAFNPDASANIFRSAHNAVLDSLNGWKHKGEAHTLLEEFKR